MNTSRPAPTHSASVQPVPLRTAYRRAPHHNLPAALSSFIGRDRECAAVTDLLRQTRLLTLTGPGGVGKTRLALEVASDVLDSYEHGVWLADLANLSNSAGLAEAIAGAVGIQEQPGEPLVDTLVRHLTTRQLLLLVDNCEHLVDACADLLSALLRGCPQLVVIATSRESLRVEGETVWLVPPLSLPDPLSVATADKLERAESVLLFVERARASTPTFTVTSDNAGIVAALCCRLEGMPLAIELAAGRVPALAVEQIVERLDDRLRLLSRGNRASPSRHQTMSAAIDWSYQLLSEPERVLFQRLSVFAGGWTLQGAESVCSGGGIEAQDVLEQLTRLLDRSLVVRMDANGAARYRLLESIREFSRQVLESGSEAEVVRERHAHHYLALAKQGESELRGPLQAEWLTRIAAEHDNLRAALRWALEQNQSILARSLAGSLWFFWANRAHLGEGRRWLEEVLARAPGGTPREVARLLHGSGALAWGQGDLDRAAKYHGQGLTLSILGDDSRGIAQALHGLALVAVQRGEYVQARSHFEQSLGLYQSIGDLDGAALERQNLGVLASKQGDNDTALHYLEASLEAARSAGNIHMAGFALSNMGGVAINRGEYGSALSLLRDALRAAQQVSAPRLVVICLEKFARVANAKGQGTRAARLVGAAESLRETHGLLESHIEHNETGQRTQVDANVHPRSRAEGQRMSMDEAVAYALSTEAADEGPLSRRELEVVRLIVGGRTNREIAEDLVIALSTAERHVANILLKLRLRSRTEIALWTVDHDVFE